MRKKLLTSTILTWLLATLLIVAAIAKLVLLPMIVAEANRAGFGAYVQIIGVFELVFAVMLLVPKTRRLGFLFLCCHLGGATAIEITQGAPPISFALIALLWLAMYLRDRSLFLDTRDAGSVAIGQ